MQAFEKLCRPRAQNKVVSLYLTFILCLHYWSGLNHAELNLAGPAVQTGLTQLTSAQFMTVYTVKQTGLTHAGPQKCASINIVLNTSTFYFRTYGAALLVLTEETTNFLACT